jgi:hypothetical protein
MTGQPQHGQYWQTQDGRQRVCVHGVTKLGTVLAEMRSGQWVDIDVNQMLADWRHLPDCDSFGWQPTRYPRYFETRNREDYAFLRQDSATDFVLVRYNGTGDEVTVVDLANRAELTEAEAKSRIEPPTPATRRTITFCEYIVWDELGCERLVWSLESDDLLYRHRYPTGQTRTVEVPE